MRSCSSWVRGRYLARGEQRRYEGPSPRGDTDGHRRRREVVDCVVTDLPFGVHCKTRARRGHLYERVLKAGAKVVSDPMTG